MEITEQALHTERSGEVRLAIFDMEPITSLCRVVRRPSGDFRLLRVADLKDGMLTTAFEPGSEWLTSLFCRDAFMEAGLYGIWKWKANPNRNDPSKIYIESEYLPNFQPIEIVLLPVNSQAEFASVLHHGIEAFQAEHNTIFAYKSGSQYCAAYCDERFLEIQENRAFIRQNVYSLPLLQLSDEEIISDAGRFFYRGFSVVCGDARIQLRDIANVARDVLLQRASWQYCKQNGLTKKEYQFIQEFLSESPPDGLIGEISERGLCSAQEAKDALQRFSENALPYLRGTAQASAVLAQTIMKTPELMDRAKKALTTEWERENEDTIHAAKQALQAVEQKRSQVEQQTADAQVRLENLRAELEQLAEQEQEKRALADAVELEVASKIDAARANMARFIAELPYVSANATLERQEQGSAFAAGKALPEAALQTCTTWQDALNVISEELPEAGIIQFLCKDLAAFLLVAYWEKRPLFLAGPNGTDIANALSVSLFGYTADRINCLCAGGDIQKTVQKAAGRVVVLEQPLHTQWENALPELSERKNKLWIFTQPYTEDMLLAPRGIWNYALPISTELLVDRAPEQQYAGGKLGVGFQFPQRKAAVFCWKGSDLLKGLSPLAIKKLADTSSDAHLLAQSGALDMDALTYGYMLAFLNDQKDALRTILDEKRSCFSGQTRILLKQMLGE